jgi:hypothetical protein
MIYDLFKLNFDPECCNKAIVLLAKSLNAFPDIILSFFQDHVERFVECENGHVAILSLSKNSRYSIRSIQMFHTSSVVENVLAAYCIVFETNTFFQSFQLDVVSCHLTSENEIIRKMSLEFIRRHYTSANGQTLLLIVDSLIRAATVCHMDDATILLCVYANSQYQRFVFFDEDISRKWLCCSPEASFRLMNLFCLLAQQDSLLWTLPDVPVFLSNVIDSGNEQTFLSVLWGFQYPKFDS